VAKSVARQLPTAVLWVRIQTSLKNDKWATFAKEWPTHSSPPKKKKKKKKKKKIANNKVPNNEIPKQQSSKNNKIPNALYSLYMIPNHKIPNHKKNSNHSKIFTKPRILVRLG
jgi:hypothetical protein